MTPAKKHDPKDALRDSLRSKLRGDNTPESEPNPTPQSPEPAHGAGLHRQIAFGAPSLAQMAAFCRQLATLIDVGIPLLQSLTTLAHRIEHPVLKRTVMDVARRVEEGQAFSDALAAHPRIFSSLIVNVVRVGESGGILEGSLLNLADVMEKRYELRRRVASALAYPVAALIVCAFVILIILGFAIPRFQEAYAEVGDMPGITLFVLSLSNFVQKTWWFLVPLVIIAILAVRYLVRSNPEARRTWHALLFKIPVVAGMAVKVNVTRTCRTLHNLLSAGIPLLEALTITAETSDNVIVGDMLHATHDHLEKGNPLVEPLRRAAVFPDLVVDMIAIGEEAGRLDTMFEKIAETYESDVNSSIRTLNAILEPALIIVMGAIVLFLALAVLLPYWRLARSFQGE